MFPNKRSICWIMVVLAIVVVTAACGGQADEANAPAAEENAAVENMTLEAEVAPEVMPEPVPEQPQEPVIEGNIVEIGEGEMDWLSAATREEPGKYYWQVRLRNDTTRTLDITVTFEFLDDNDGNIKTDNATRRLEPGREGTFRVEDEMVRDQARAVASYGYTWDFAIATED